MKIGFRLICYFCLLFWAVLDSNMQWNACFMHVFFGVFPKASRPFSFISFKVCTEFQHLVVDDIKWSRMTHDQRKAKLNVHRKTGMDGKKTHLDVHDVEKHDDVSNQQALPKKPLLLSAAESVITSIPMPVLDSMFERANRQLESPENVISKPGATDSSLIVAGYSSKILVVTSGKRWLHQMCINSSTKI